MKPKHQVQARRRTGVNALLVLAFLANFGNVLSMIVADDSVLRTVGFDGVWTRSCAILVMLAALLSLWVDRGDAQDEADLRYIFAASCLNFLMPFGALAFTRGTWILTAPAIACSIVALLLFVRERKPAPPNTSTTTWIA